MKLHISIAIITLFYLKTTLANSTPRNEISRYTLLNDKMIVDQELFTEKYSNFFDFEIDLSSGLKTLIGDVSNSTTNTSSQTEKELNIYKLMAKNTNTERFAKIRGTLAVPMPLVKIKRYKFLPALFYNLDYGVSLSFSSTNDPTDPLAQIYIKKDKKIGLNTKINTGDPDEVFDVSFYRMERSDLYSQSTKTTIATHGKLFNFDDLSSKKHIMWAGDIGYKKTNGLSNYAIDIQEIKLFSASSTSTQSKYGTSPLIHLGFFRVLKTEPFNLNFYIGHHYRKKYALYEGLYFAVKYASNSIPTLFTAKISSEFLTLSPELVTKYFHIYYKIKTPYQNPMDDMWVSAIHSLNIAFPFF